jgi:hypothetical protein
MFVYYRYGVVPQDLDIDGWGMELALGFHAANNLVEPC